MKINSVRSTYQVYQKAKAQPTKQTNAVKSSGFAIELSNKAKEYQFAMDKLKEVPEVRMDKVSSLKEQINSGTYSLDPQRTAKAMMQSFTASI